MSTKSTIDNLWQQFRDSINKAYKEKGASHPSFDDDFACLRDYAEDISWSDDTAALLGRECANERQHRKGAPLGTHRSIAGFSVESASKLILLEQVANGSKLSEMPRATAFLVFRKTAIEAQVLGYIIREYLPADFFANVKALDYSELMKGKV